MEKLTIHYDSSEEIRLEDLIPQEYKYQFLRAEVNDRLRELSYKTKGPVKIEFFSISNDTEAMLIYKRTLMYVIAMALYNLFPDEAMLFSNDVSRSFFIRPKDSNTSISPRKIYLLNQEIKRIINEDYPIEKLEIPKEDAIQAYSKQNYKDKLEILKYRKEPNVHLYRCNGYYDYMYGYMAPSTKYVAYYNIIARMPGFLVQYPRTEEYGKIPPFIPETVFERTLQKTRDFLDNVNLNTIYGVNSFVKDYSENDFIQMSETYHNNQMAALGNAIVNSNSKIRLICIAGPSSSGKTTFSNKLRLELMSKGIFPIRISLDDYYLEREQLEKQADGTYDLESISALNVELFNEQMYALINGETVQLPYFNFKTGKSEKGRVLTLQKDQPIIVEGIHAISEEMTKSIPHSAKFKIFIAPQAQINIDDHNPISLTDLRLLRRIVRDAQFRSSSAEETISMWPKVRNGEFNYIYNNQQEADFVFNSFLPYELLVISKYAIPLLKKIEKTSPYYVIARRLILSLKYYIELEDETLIPNNSLIREFIGGSCFKDI